MRIVLAVATLLIAVSAYQPAAEAQSSYAWCAIYSGRAMGGSKSCSFRTWEQCQAQVSGIGGFCQPNYYAQGQQPRRKTKRVRTYQY